MRVLLCLCLLVALGSCDKEEVYFIPGTGTLPDCTETPAVNLDGTCWIDRGTVTIQSMGCADLSPNDTVESCTLAWYFTQTDNDVTIFVDGEYRVEGRICGDKLYLRGGWWLPVPDENQRCTYADDTGEEVVIQSEGNVLTYAPAADMLGERMTGVLAIKGPCDATYDVAFEPGNSCYFAE